MYIKKKKSCIAHLRQRRLDALIEQRGIVDALPLAAGRGDAGQVGHATGAREAGGSVLGVVGAECVPLPTIKFYSNCRNQY